MIKIIRKDKQQNFVMFNSRLTVLECFRIEFLDFFKDFDDNFLLDLFNFFDSLLFDFDFLFAVELRDFLEFIVRTIVISERGNK